MELKYIPLDEIRVNPIKLRPVDVESASYRELVNTVPTMGILNPILVQKQTATVTDDEGTPIIDDAGNSITEEFYEVVEGGHRFAAAKACGLETIPCQISDKMDETTMMTAQVIGNLVRVETKPVEYKNQLLRIMAKNKTWTEADMANALGVSVDFIRKRLSLGKIENEEILKLIDQGKVCLSNAFNLAKLPVDKQAEMLDSAMTEDAGVFAGEVKKLVKEINDAKRQGREVSDEFPGAIPRGRKVKELEAELEAPATVLKDVEGLTEPTEIVSAVLRWCLHLDSESVAIAKDKHDAKVAERKEKARRRSEAAAAKKAEKASKTAEEAAKAAEAAMAEAKKMTEGIK